MKSFGWVKTVLIYLSAAASLFAETEVRKRAGSINGAGVWSAGIPSSANPGRIEIDGHWLTGANFAGWTVSQSAGTITRTSGNLQLTGGAVWNLSGGALEATSGMVRVGLARPEDCATLNMSGGCLSAAQLLDLANKKSVFNLSGGSIAAGGLRLSNGAQVQVDGGHGEFSGALLIGNSRTQIVLNGGTLSFEGNLVLTPTTNNRSGVRFGLGNGRLIVSGIQPGGKGRIDFDPASDGTLTISGGSAADFETLWNEQVLGVGGNNFGAFQDHFVVSGSTLQLKR